MSEDIVFFSAVVEPKSLEVLAHKPSCSPLLLFVGSASVAATIRARETSYAIQLTVKVTPSIKVIGNLFVLHFNILINYREKHLFIYISLNL